MNLASLTADLARAQAEFARLSKLHWIKPAHLPRQYRTLRRATEHRIVLLAERIERLQRFSSWMRAKALDRSQ